MINEALVPRLPPPPSHCPQIETEQASVESISTDKGDLLFALVSKREGNEVVGRQSSVVVGGSGVKKSRVGAGGELCAEGGCGSPEARPLQGSVAERETRQVHPSHAHSLSHHCRRFLPRSDFIAVLLLLICAQALCLGIQCASVAVYARFHCQGGGGGRGGIR